MHRCNRNWTTALCPCGRGHLLQVRYHVRGLHVAGRIRLPAFGPLPLSLRSGGGPSLSGTCCRTISAMLGRQALGTLVCTALVLGACVVAKASCAALSTLKCVAQFLARPVSAEETSSIEVMLFCISLPAFILARSFDCASRASVSDYWS